MHHGQDESIFKLYAFSKMGWSVDNEQPLLPKNEGPSRMLSVFVNRILGETLILTPVALTSTLI